MTWTIVDTRTGQRASIARYVSKPQATAAIEQWQNRYDAQYLEPVRTSEMETR